MGARQTAVGMFTAEYSVTTIRTTATEGKRQYSYEKEAVLSDKQFTSQLLGAYNS